MQIFDPSVKLLEESNPFIKIERAGRLCYKSESEYTVETGKKFFKQLVERGHTAMLEHAVVVFQVTALPDQTLQELDYDLSILMSLSGKFLNYTCVGPIAGEPERILVSGSIRAINECGIPSIQQALYQVDPDLLYSVSNKEVFSSPLPKYCRQGKWHYIEDIASIIELRDREFMTHFHCSYQIVCDRGVTHELVRHRPASFAQESTRYCNYSKEKFGSAVSFIYPSTFSDWSDSAQKTFLEFLDSAEKSYMKLLENGATPQEARAVLPNALKTEIIITANGYEFEHIFNLRSREITGKAHPDMKVVAVYMEEIFENTIKKVLPK